jgi:hypothetical protein
MLDSILEKAIVLTVLGCALGSLLVVCHGILSVALPLSSA